ATKTGHGRIVPLQVSPSLLAWLAKERLAASCAYVFGSVAEVDGKRVELPLPRDQAEAARRRLIARFGAPVFTWHDLRRTCGTFLPCAPGIYGAASAFLSAKRLGHSVTVAERLYTASVSNIPAAAATLEQAMSIEPVPAGRTNQRRRA